MKIDILTLFPKMFDGPFSESIVDRAIKQKKVEINICDIRTWGEGKRRTVDDHPYGGGIGMVLMVEPIYKALKAIGVIGTVKKILDRGKTRVILMSPRGAKYDQNIAKRLASYKRIVLLCGHYEGLDERINKYIDEEISLGDFVMTGGEIAAMAITDSIVRLIPDVLKEGVTENESFSGEYKYLEYPQYTRPISFKGEKVPEVLRSGNHKLIDEWRLQKAKEKTAKARPDLLK